MGGAWILFGTTFDYGCDKEIGTPPAALFTKAWRGGGVFTPCLLNLYSILREQDVSAVDVNMGCSKDYSIKVGYYNHALKFSYFKDC